MTAIRTWITCSLVFSHASLALAQVSPAPTHPEQESGGADATASCELSGKAYVARNTPILAANRNQSPVAVFTGMPAELSVATRANADGVRVETLGGFHIEGIIDDASKIQLFTRHDVPVKTGVWIAAGTDVRLIGVQRSQLRVEKTVVQSRIPLRTWAKCASLALEQPASGWSDAPERARAYLASQGEVSFLRGPSHSADELIQLTAPAYSDGLLLWGTHRRDGFVRVYYRDQITVEAWVDGRELELTDVPWSERPGPERMVHALPNLELTEEMRLFESRRAIPIRVRASKRAPVVGLIEPGTEVLVSDEGQSDWAGVLPKDLVLAAPGRSNFWVPAREVSTP